MTRTIGLLVACDDPQLLGLDPWPEQRNILQTIDSGDYREVVLALGRRSGKSLMSAAVAVHDAAFRDLTAYLRPGEVRHVLCVAASREQAGVVFRFARGLLADSPLLRDTIVAETADSITVRQPATGAEVVIRTAPCSARTIRGLAVSTAILDELAHFADATDGPAVAAHVYRSVLPSLAQFQEHGRLLAISTPWGRSGTFFDLYTRAESGAREGAIAINASTREMNPTLSDDYFAEQRANDPELFAGEFEAAFTASGGAFFDWDRIQAAVADDRFELPADDAHSPVAALDPAFARDPFALAIVDRDPERAGRLRLALSRSWLPEGGELAFDSVLDQVAEICHRYGATRVVVDQFCSAPVCQRLAAKGLAAREVTMTATSKTAIYSTLKAKLYAGELELYRHEPLLAELSRIEAHYTAGSASIRIPRVGRSHGDLAQALALGVHELRHRPPRGHGVRLGVRRAGVLDV